MVMQIHVEIEGKHKAKRGWQVALDDCSTEGLSKTTAEKW